MVACGSSCALLFFPAVVKSPTKALTASWMQHCPVLPMAKADHTSNCLQTVTWEPFPKIPATPSPLPRSNSVKCCSTKRLWESIPVYQTVKGRIPVPAATMLRLDSPLDVRKVSVKAV